jgi:hypothetical protein
MKNESLLEKTSGVVDHNYRIPVMFVVAMVLVFMAQNAMAFTVPTSGSFAYDLYDLAVNQILKGPIGFVAGIGFLILCVFAIAKQMVLPAILCLFAGVILIEADSILVTLGGLVI